MAAGSTYTPIATTTLGSDTTTVTFSSISGSYTDLVLVAGFGSNRDGAGFSIRVGNGSVDTGTNYSNTNLYGTGSSAASDRTTSYSYFSTFPNIGFSTTLNANNLMISIMNYSNSTTYKTLLSRGNNAAGTNYPGTIASAGLWRSTSAINTVSLFGGGTDKFLSGSTFTLYGITAA